MAKAKKAASAKKAQAEQAAAPALELEIPPAKKRGPGGRQPGAGRPPFRPTAEDRARVTLLAGLIKHEDIPKLVFNPQTGNPIDYKTLRRHFGQELDTGKMKLDSRVAESLVKRALDHSHPQGATCAIFYAKTRMGWRETTVLEVEGKAGVLVAPMAVSVDGWLAKVQERNTKAVEPGLEEPE